MTFPTPDNSDQDCKVELSIPEKFIPLLLGILTDATATGFWRKSGELTSNEASDVIDNVLSSLIMECIKDNMAYVGQIIIFPKAVPLPQGLIVADGRAVSRTEYSELFNLYGTTFGAGDGATTFNVYDANKFLLGAGSTRTIGETGGAETHTLTEAELPSHQHEQQYWQSTGQQVGFSGISLTNPTPQGLNTLPTGGDQPHNNMPPYDVVLMCIVGKLPA